MRIHISQLILEPLRHSHNEIVDDGADCAECSDGFAVSVVHFNVDDVLFRVGEADGEMVEVFDEFASGAFDCYYARFYVHFHCEVGVWSVSR